MRPLDTDIVVAYLRGNTAIAERLKTNLPEVAIANNATLVTHNLKHYENIEGLRLEDWLVQS
ncbi:MAG: hypothetical protein HZC40_23650 [Chloroflexi bacterium]|nr:hypothetical protein [Chloroflexota bacterium]